MLRTLIARWSRLDDRKNRAPAAASSSRAVLVMLLPLLLLGPAALPGCQTQETVPPTETVAEGPDYSRPLPPGAPALRKVNPSEVEAVRTAYRNRNVLLLQALDRSAEWFRKPSSRTHFPVQGITHEQAEESVLALRQLFESSVTETEFLEAIERDFDVYESVGYDDRGTVLFTGYYAPIMHASRERSTRFRYPLYRRPSDLVTDERTGTPQGRRTPDGVEPYPTRREIEEGELLAGSELVWLESPLDAYIIHVNGSAKLRLPDDSTMYIGYAGKTDRPYASLGKALVDAGVLPPGGVTLQTIEDAYEDHPNAVREAMYRNESYVFFMEYPAEHWPAGSLGFPVTAERSLATDKSVYPRGGLVLIDTTAVNFSGSRRSFQQFMLDQDTGGAIRAPGRADIFMGVGPGAEILAGSQHAEGRLYYIFLKPDRLPTTEPTSLARGRP